MREYTRQPVCVTAVSRGYRASPYLADLSLVLYGVCTIILFGCVGASLCVIGSVQNHMFA